MRPEARSGDGRALWCEATASGWAAAPAGGNQSAAGAVCGRRVGALCVGGDRPAVPIRIRLVTDGRTHARTHARTDAYTHARAPTCINKNAYAHAHALALARTGAQGTGGPGTHATHPLRACVRACRDELWGIANRGDFDLRVHQESSGHRLTFRDGPAADAEEVGSTSKYLGLHGGAG